MSEMKQQLTNDLTDAMRRRDAMTTSTLRLVKAAIMKAEVAGTTAVELDDQQILVILATEMKKRVEAADLYDQGGRTELATKERGEAAIIQRYLPTALTDDELNAVVATAVAETTIDASNPGKAMGMIVKVVREQVGQRADGGRIAAAVKSQLNG